MLNFKLVCTRLVSFRLFPETILFLLVLQSVDSLKMYRCVSMVSTKQLISYWILFQMHISDACVLYTCLAFITRSDYQYSTFIFVQHRSACLSVCQRVCVLTDPSIPLTPLKKTKEREKATDFAALYVFTSAQGHTGCVNI